MVDKPQLLVTGGAGYIGSHTSSLLSQNGYQVTVLDNLSRGHRRSLGNWRLYQTDLRDDAALKRVFKKHNFDAVIHFAGLINVGESMKKPDLYFENNVSGTINLLNAMATCQVKHLVFSSSAAVYGNPKKVPIKETSSKNPTNVYGQTKLIIEDILPSYRHRFGLESISLRYFNAAGASLDGQNGEAHAPEGHLIPLLLRAALRKNSQFLLYGNDYPTPDGTCIRDYIHVVDLAQAHMQGLKYLLSGKDSINLNLGTGTGFSNKQVIQAVKRITQAKFKVQTTGRRAGDPAHLVADNRLALKVLKWQPHYSDLDTIITTALKWHKTHPFSLKT